jgi:integrase/recombinase XerD
MKLYPDVFLEFAATSGRLRTDSSRNSFMWVVRQLQAEYPRQAITQFTTEQLTRFCIGKDSAPNTIKHRVAVLRGVFDWAVYKGYVRENPTTALKYTVSPGKHEVRQGKWLTKEQAGLVIRSCDDTIQGRRNRLILLFGFLMGLRRAEIARIRWSDLSADMRQLRVLGKGQKIATAGVPPQLAAELQAWRKIAPMEHDTVLPSMKEIGLDGTREQVVHWDRPLERSGIYEVIKGPALKCELKLAPHDLRRTFAGILEDEGIPVTDIQRAMRHANVGITSTYLDKNPRKAVAVTEGLTIDY